MKKYSKNKIEADDLIKQVRQRIKETTWEKQNQREGFTETFKPLISQFEKPEDPEKENIFTQNQKMLRNQLALTEGLKENQKAITDGFSQFEKLADIRELPGVEAIEHEEYKDDQARAPLPKEDKTLITNLNIEKNFSEEDIDFLTKLNYIRPKDFYLNTNEDLEKELEDVKIDIKKLTGEINGRKRKQNPSVDYLTKTSEKEIQKGVLLKYKNAINDHFTSLKYKLGQGLYFSPQELLHRFELLNGSLAAGNNGVLPEFIQIAHRLRDLGIITNNQLNKLLRKII